MGIVPVLYKLFVSLSLILVPFFPFHGKAVKRESGANPEQTRCCKLRQSFQIILRATVPARNGKDVRKWSKSEDLPKNSVVSRLSRNEVAEQTRAVHQRYS
jgi:hypothetical protein